MGWYLTITSDMREAGLNGNGLLIYALVFGYSQGEQGCYYGSLAHTAEVVGCTAETARTTLRALLDSGLVERFEFMDNGVHRVAYRATQKIWDTQKILGSHPKNLGSTTQKIWDNNTNNNTSDKKVSRDNIARFTPPTLEDVRAYCLSRANGINPESFIDYYTANGWKVGRNPMRDWRAAVRQWEQRRHEAPTPQAPRPRQQQPPVSVWEANARAVENIQRRLLNGQYDEQ